MSATYTVIVSKELLADIEKGEHMPAGFRMVRVVGEVPGRSGEPPSFRSFYVEFEDDDAPAALDGKLVEPSFQAHYEDGKVVKVTISERRLVDAWWQR